jgi:hypothetical protein
VDNFPCNIYHLLVKKGIMPCECVLSLAQRFLVGSSFPMFHIIFIWVLYCHVSEEKQACDSLFFLMDGVVLYRPFALSRGL